MGVQSLYIKDIHSITRDSNNYLKKHALEEYLNKYYLIGNCSKTSEEDLRYNYIISEYLNIDDCTIVDYVNKKVSGELDQHYRRRKLLQKIDSIEFEWECNDMYEDTSCCDWKAIEW